MSINQYYAEKKDIMDIFNLLVEYKKIDLEDCNYPDIDQDKSLNFLHTILAKGKIILLKWSDTADYSPRGGAVEWCKSWKSAHVL